MAIRSQAEASMGTESTSFTTRAGSLRRKRSTRCTPQHVGGWSERISHYFFVFHDEMFEALARSVSVEEVQGTMSELLTSAASRIIHA